MANNRKTTKYGSRTVSQGVGGTTSSYSGGSTMKNGRGIRRTTTVKSNGQRYIRETTGSGNGWYKTTQKSLNPRKPKGIKKAKSNFNGLAGDGSGTGYVLLFFFCIWAIVETINWVRIQLQPIFNFFNTHNIIDIITVLTICVIGSWVFLKMIFKLWNRWFK